MPIAIPIIAMLLPDADSQSCNVGLGQWFLVKFQVPAANSDGVLRCDPVQKLFRLLVCRKIQTLIGVSGMIHCQVFAFTTQPVDVESGAKLLDLVIAHERYGIGSDLKWPPKKYDDIIPFNDSFAALTGVA